MKVTYFQRPPLPGMVSIEGVFDCLRKELPPEVDWEIFTCPRPSRGILPRLMNILGSSQHQSEINHITGDVHYLTFGLEKKRTLLTIHDCGGMERLRGWKKEIFRRFWIEQPVKHCAKVVAISEYTKKDILSYLPPGDYDIRVIHNAVDPAFVPAPREFRNVDPVLLFIGVTPNKNLLRTIEALCGLKVVLKIVGQLSQEYQTALDQSGVRYENVGKASREEMVLLYQNCDLVLFPSTFEGFGLPIVEGQATGRPVITSRVTSIPEVAGEAAELVDPNSVSDIREAVKRLCGDPNRRAELVSKGLQNVKRFTPKRQAGLYYDLYREILAAQ